MLKLLLGFLVAVFVVLLVAQAAGPGASAEVAASTAEDGPVEADEQADSPQPARSSSPVQAQGSSMGGGGGMAVPK